MQVDFTRDGKTELIRVATKSPPLLMILTTIAALLMLQSATVLLTQALATPLFALIAINLICATWLLVVCAEQIMPTTLRLEKEALVCQRLLTHKTYNWDEIAGLKLVPAGAVSDVPRHDNRGRVGVGLLSKVATKPTGRDAKAQHAVQPTATVLVSGDSEYAEKMMEIIEMAQKFQAKLNAKPTERWKRAPQPQQQPQFRKKPNITMPA
jgi:hypothetical protein